MQLHTKHIITDVLYTFIPCISSIQYKFGINILFGEIFLWSLADDFSLIM